MFFFLKYFFLFIDHKTKNNCFLEYECLKNKCNLLLLNFKYLKIISSHKISENFFKNERYFAIYDFSFIKGCFVGFFFHHRNDFIENYFLNFLNKKKYNLNMTYNMNNVCHFYNNDDYFIKVRPMLKLDKLFFHYFLYIFKDYSFFIDYESFLHSKRYLIRENLDNYFNKFNYINYILSYNSFLKKNLFLNNMIKKDFFLIKFFQSFFYFSNYFFFSLEIFIKIIKFLFYQKKNFNLQISSGFFYFILLVKRFFYRKIQKKNVFFLIKFDNIKVYIFLNKLFVNIC